MLWGRELGMMVFALAVEIIVDLAAMTAELWRELPLKEVWKCKTKLHIWWEEGIIMTASIFGCLVIFRVSPTYGFCESSSTVCSCGGMVESSRILEEIC